MTEERAYPEDLDIDDCCPNCGGEGIVPGCMVDFCDCGGEDDADLCCAPRRCDWCKPPPPGKE